MAEDNESCGGVETFAVSLHNRRVYGKVNKAKLKNRRDRIWRILQ